MTRRDIRALIITVVVAIAAAVVATLIIVETMSPLRW